MRSTRREFLARSGAIAGTALFAGTAVVLPGTAAPAAGLTETRRATYRALADTVVTGPAMRLDPVNATAALDAFARVYDGWPADERARADRTLDALASQSGVVRGEAPRLHSALPAGAERRDIVLLEAAVALVAVVVGQPDGGHDSELI